MAGKGLLVWLAGGVGVFLLYSAVSDQTPLSLIKSYLGSGSPEKFPVGGGGSAPTPFKPSPSPLSPFYVAPYTGSPLDPNMGLDAPGTNGSKGSPSQGSGSPFETGGYTGGGVYDLIDANGNNLGAIPAAYQNNPNAYVPPPGGHIQNA